MECIYFGKCKSKLKYIISPKLKIYINMVIETVLGDKFNCIASGNMCNSLRNIWVGTYLVVIGNAKNCNDKVIILVEDYETVS